MLQYIAMLLIIMLIELSAGFMVVVFKDDVSIKNKAKSNETA